MTMLVVYLTGLLRNQTLGIRKAGIMVQRKMGGNVKTPERAMLVSCFDVYDQLTDRLYNVNGKYDRPLCPQGISLSFCRALGLGPRNGCLLWLKGYVS